MKKKLGLLLTCVVLLTGCHYHFELGGIQGSGVKASNVREVGEFTGIEVRCSADVRVHDGKEQSVTVEGDDNLLELITTEVKDNMLIVSSTEPISTRIGITVSVNVQQLESIHVMGSGDVRVEDVDAATLTLSINGSGDIDASGTAEKVDLEIQGSGDADLSNLITSDATVQVSDSGDVIVHATENLSATINGSGDIHYKGKPNVQQNVTGSGDVEPK